MSPEKLEKQNYEIFTIQELKPKPQKFAKRNKKMIENFNN